MIDFTRFSRLVWVLAVLSWSGAAFGAVKLEGTWLEVDKPITLDASKMPRSEAVRRIADAAGWNIVWSSPSADLVDVHVKKQPATQVLELILSDGDYVARRKGDLIQIERDKGAPAAVPIPPTPPLPGLAPLPPLPGLAPPPASSATPDAAVDDDEEENPDPNPL